MRVPMMRPLIILAVLTTILYLAWRWIDPIVTVRCRLTLYVEVGDLSISGSGVWEDTFHSTWIFPMAGSWTDTFKGEAVAVDLGARGVLVATLLPDETRKSSISNDGLVTKALGPLPSSDGGLIANWRWEMHIRGDAVEVPLESLPMLFCFHDRSDQHSFDRVSPDDLAKAFGPDVRLVRATIQAVPRGWWPFSLLNLSRPTWLFGIPVTTGIEHFFPWLQQLDDRPHVLYTSKHVFGSSHEYQLSKIQFIWGIY